MRRKIKTNTCPASRLLRNTIFISALSFLVYFPSAHCQSLKLLASDANADDRFGVSVAIDANLVVVGAYQTDSNGSNSGAAYVYELSGSQWVEKQKLIASDASAGAQFGRSVAIEGNTIVVGSYHDANTGSAYVFTRSAGIWSQQQKLTASDAAANDKFGGCVSIDNNTIVVGAYGDNQNTGAAYVFVRYGSVWAQQQKLIASDFNEGDYFGYSVAMDLNTILVGAHKTDTFEKTDVGSAYVFAHNEPNWTQQSILRASDSIGNDVFGWSVAIDGNWAVVGASGCDSSAGAAYIFERNGAAWSQRQKIIDPDQPGSNEKFGSSVAIHNERIVIGCTNDSIADQNSGAAYGFVLDDSTWIYSTRFLASDANEDDEFGSSVALSADHIIVGSPYNDDNGISSGSAYIFDAFINGSSFIFKDFAALAAAWLTSIGQPLYNPVCDISNPTDSVIDFRDLEALCNAWLAGK